MVKEETDDILAKLSIHPHGWGPIAIPIGFEQIPYTPFSKLDRIGKIADWAAPAEEQGSSEHLPGKELHVKSRRRFGASAEAFGTGLVSAFSYQVSVEDEANFSVVDRAAPPKKSSSFKGPAKGAQSAWGRGAAAGQGMAKQAYGNKRFMGRGGMSDKNMRVRDPSIKVGPEWVLVEEMDFVRLNKLYFEVDEPKDLGVYGSINYFDRQYERISAKNEKQLLGTDKHLQNVTTSEDTILQKLSNQDTEPTVYATDTILSFLMASTRSVYSWDMIVTKEGNKLWLDKREGSAFDLVSVNENATEAPTDDKESMNSALALSMEASYVNRCFTQQAVVATEKVEFSRPNPLQPVGEPAVPPCVYRYRQWALGSDVNLVLRTHLDAALQQSGSNAGIVETFEATHGPAETQFVTLNTLLEYDARVSNTPDWRQKLDSMKGAVLATELKNNGVKLARWTLEALLSGADQMRIGFVSRQSPKDRRRHVLLGSGLFKPQDFASQINFDVNAGWGIVKTVVDLFLKKLEDGKYVLMKDPNKPVLRLYAVPAGALERDDSVASVDGSSVVE